VQHGDSGWTRLHGCRSARVHRMGKALGVDLLSFEKLTKILY